MKVTLKNAKKVFQKTVIISRLNLEISSKEFLVLVGPSGCGKSTLLRMIAGLEDFSAGEIYLNEMQATKLSPKERGVAMVFQNYALYPHMSVRDNICFGLRIAKLPNREVAERLEEAANILNLTQLLERKPAQLSGGQKQRVAMARAMVRRPQLFLFDEPLSNLDAQLRVKMRAEIASLHKRLGCTSIYVTHDQSEAMTLADRIAVMKEGNIMQLGTPMNLYQQPVNSFVAGFIGSPQMNFFPGAFVQMKAHKVGIRPEHLSLEPSDKSPVLRGMRVQQIETLGANRFIHALFPNDQNATIVAEDRAMAKPIRLGDSIDIFFNQEKAYFFDEQGLTQSGPL